MTETAIAIHKHVEKKPSRTRKKTILSVSRTRTVPAARNDNLVRWCMAYVTLAAVMSMGLNTWSNGQHAPTGTQWAAWGMGAAIPASNSAVGISLLGPMLCVELRFG